jgi:hypothetical protein
MASSTLLQFGNGLFRPDRGFRRALRSAPTLAWAEFWARFWGDQPSWFTLNEHLLRDIGKTCADAERAKLLHSYNLSSPPSQFTSPRL